jgi:hypothetical protein
MYKISKGNGFLPYLQLLQFYWVKNNFKVKSYTGTSGRQLIIAIEKKTPLSVDCHSL